MKSSAIDHTPTLESEELPLKLNGSGFLEFSCLELPIARGPPRLQSLGQICQE